MEGLVSIFKRMVLEVGILPTIVMQLVNRCCDYKYRCCDYKYLCWYCSCFLSSLSVVDRLIGPCFVQLFLLHRCQSVTPAMPCVVSSKTPTRSPRPMPALVRYYRHLCIFFFSIWLDSTAIICTLFHHAPYFSLFTAS